MLHGEREEGHRLGALGPQLLGRHRQRWCGGLGGSQPKPRRCNYSKVFVVVRAFLSGWRLEREDHRRRSDSLFMSSPWYDDAGIIVSAGTAEVGAIVGVVAQLHELITFGALSAIYTNPARCATGHNKP